VSSFSYIPYGLCLILRGRTVEVVFQMLMHRHWNSDCETEHCSSLPCDGGMGAANDGIIRVIRPQRR
jgi:hypothetical protein